MFCRLLYTSVTVRDALGKCNAYSSENADRLTDSINGRVRAGKIDVFKDINTLCFGLVNLAKFGFATLSDKDSLSRLNVLDLGEVGATQGDVFGCQHVILSSRESNRGSRAKDKGPNAMGISHSKNTAAALIVSGIRIDWVSGALNESELSPRNQC